MYLYDRMCNYMWVYILIRLFIHLLISQSMYLFQCKNHKWKFKSRKTSTYLQQMASEKMEERKKLLLCAAKRKKSRRFTFTKKLPCSAAAAAAAGPTVRRNNEYCVSWRSDDARIWCYEHGTMRLWLLIYMPDEPFFCYICSCSLPQQPLKRYSFT